MAKKEESIFTKGLADKVHPNYNPNKEYIIKNL